MMEVGRASEKITIDPAPENVSRVATFSEEFVEGLDSV
jgi:hypothetical protein